MSIEVHATAVVDPKAQLAEVESRIARLLNLRKELSRMVKECGRGVVAECRVIEALAAGS